MAQAMSSSFPTAFGGGAHDVPPIMDNTTPLIDVMLVLLIMFIITVPMQTHQIEQQLPKPGTTLEINRVKNEVGLSAAGQLSWNDRAIGERDLAGALGAISRMDEQPEVHFRPDAAARYERVDQVLGIAAKSGADRFGFVGNEKYDGVF